MMNTKWKDWLFCAGVSAFGLYMMWGPACNLCRVREASQWPTATGALSYCRLLVHEGSGRYRPTTYHYDLAYVYVVDGKLYTGTRLAVTGNEADRDEIERFKLTHPAGTPLIVRYDPANPEEAILDTRRMVWLWPRFLAGVVFTLMGAGLFGGMWIRSGRPLP